MVRHRAPIGLTAAVLISVVTGAGCGVDRAQEPAASGVSVAPPSAIATLHVTPPAPPAAIPPDLLCTSVIDADGLLCSQCADHPGAAPECLAAACTVDNHCLRCTDPKGRTGVDCSIDYDGAIGGGYGSSGGTFGFASCWFVWGDPRTSGTQCQYPGGNTCQVEEYDLSHCLECRYSDGSGGGVCGDKSNPLYDPLINRPDDLPGPGACANDLSADGKVECTTCVHDDLSATRACHYPGIVDCDLSNAEDEAAGCIGRCTFRDGHQERICDSLRGAYPVPLP